MKKLIYIKDTNTKGLLEVDLKMLLDDMEVIGEKYIWSILLLEASGDIGPKFSYTSIDEAITNTTKGYCLSWDELKDISGKFHQVINMLLVASENKDNIKFYKDDISLYMNYPITIEIVDGDFWEVCTADENLITLFQNKYKDVEIKNIL